MNPKHILIVDDMRDARTLLKLILTTKAHFAVSEATGGTDALQIVAQNRPDLIVLDYMMPDMDGIAVCQQLRANPQTADLPVLMLTARTEADLQMRSLKAGATSFMTKPVMPSDLIEEVNRLLTAEGHTRAQVA